MTCLAERLRSLVREERGATATEYAIMLVLIIMVAIATIVIMGERVENAFNTFVTLFNQTG